MNEYKVTYRSAKMTAAWVKPGQMKMTVLLRSLKGSIKNTGKCRLKVVRNYKKLNRIKGIFDNSPFPLFKESN